MKSSIVVAALSISLTSCAPIPVNDVGPKQGSIYKDKEIDLSIYYSKSHAFQNSSTCEVGLRLINLSSKEVEPKFKITFLNSQGNTIDQKEANFPVVLPGKSFNGATYLYESSCKNVATAIAKREG